VGVKKQADDVYAVEISINAKAERDKAILFNVELVYGGVYRVRNFNEQQLEPLLMIECPQMIFPFARQVLAATVQAGGFPPVMMEPVDFRQIYVQNLRALAQQQGQPAPQAN
jgi:preprotein translocase subunit SecB